MITPQEYIENKYPIIPCYKNERRPIGKEWEEKETGKLERFSPGDNIGLHLINYIDLDIDNPVCHKFLKRIKTLGCAVYGRQSNPESHLLFRGSAEYEKYCMHRSFEPWYKKYRKEKTILEIRSGKGLQSIAPGSVIEDEEVRWDKYIEPKEYPGELRKDIDLVVFATMLSIIYPGKGERDDFCYAIACLLKKWGSWKEELINTFIEELAEASEPIETRDKDDKRNNFGTRAYKGNTPKGLPTLIKQMNFPEDGIKDIFKVVGITIGKETEEQKEKKITNLKMYDWNDYLHLDIKEPEFIVAKLFKTKSINFISGPKGNGKTEWTLGLTDIISKGGDFLTYKVNEPYPVIYIDGEMDEYDLIERRIPYTQHEAPYPNYFNIIHYAQQIDQTIPDIKFEHGQQLIEQKVMEVRQKTGKSPVLVLDNLRSLSNYKENDSDDWRPIGVWLKNLRALDCVTIVIDHHGKGENAGPRGSSSKTDWANVSIFIKSVGKGRTPGKMRMEIKFDKARGLRPDETQEYECEYDFDGKWTRVDSQKTQSEELLLEAIYNIKRDEFNKCRTEEKKLDKDLEKERITKKIYNKLRKAVHKEHTSTQQEIADKIGISVGKYNQLYNSSYENYFARKTNEEYLAKKNSPLGDGVSEEEIKQYQELVDKWTKEREEKFPSKDFGLKYIFPDKYPGGDKLPTKDWLRSNDFYKNDFEAIKKAWITHCNINMEDYE
jgi:hypothetical protein